MRGVEQHVDGAAEGSGNEPVTTLLGANSLESTARNFERNVE